MTNTAIAWFLKQSSDSVVEHLGRFGYYDDSIALEIHFTSRSSSSLIADGMQGLLSMLCDLPAEPDFEEQRTLLRLKIEDIARRLRAESVPPYKFDSGIIFSFTSLWLIVFSFTSTRFIYL